MTPAHAGGRGREIAFGGLFGAAALVLPVLFHLVHLGHVFMPMYLPLMALPFFVGPAVAILVAALVPMLSALLTGMPPLFPPVAPVMSLELACMAGLVALVRRYRPSLPVLALLVPVLLFGRVLHVALVYAIALWLELPADYLAGLSFLAGWPGVVVMILVVPPVTKLRRLTGGGHAG